MSCRFSACLSSSSVVRRPPTARGALCVPSVRVPCCMSPLACHCVRVLAAPACMYARVCGVRALGLGCRARLWWPVCLPSEAPHVRAHAPAPASVLIYIYYSPRFRIPIAIKSVSANLRIPGIILVLVPGPHLPRSRLRSRHHPARYQRQARLPPSLYMLFRCGQSPSVFVPPSSVSPAAFLSSVVCGSSAFAVRLLLVASGLAPPVHTSVARHALPRLRCTPRICVSSRVHTQIQMQRPLAARCALFAVCQWTQWGQHARRAAHPPHSFYIIISFSLHACPSLPPFARGARVPPTSSPIL